MSAPYDPTRAYYWELTLTPLIQHKHRHCFDRCYLQTRPKRGVKNWAPSKTPQGAADITMKLRWRKKKCLLTYGSLFPFVWKQVKSMSPAELKGALQRTFDIRLSSPQLGAMAHLFGTGTGTAETEYYEGGKGSSSNRVCTHITKLFPYTVNQDYEQDPGTNIKAGFPLNKGRGGGAWATIIVALETSRRDLFMDTSLYVSALAVVEETFVRGCVFSYHPCDTVLSN